MCTSKYREQSSPPERSLGPSTNLQFRAAVTLHGISSVQCTADRIFVFKFKKLKLQTITVSGFGFCNVAQILSFFKICGMC